MPLNASITGVMIFSSGKLTRLRELLVSYNRLNCIPEELCSCECLERLELAMNRDLDELPQQVVDLLVVAFIQALMQLTILRKTKRVY